MKAELRDSVILEMEQCLMRAGAKNYDEGMEQVAKLLTFVQSHFHPMRTKEQLTALLDQMQEPTASDRLIIFGGFKILPGILRFGLKELSKKADEDLPGIPSGHPGLDLQTKAKIIAFVGKQEMTGYSRELAKKCAARHFGVSEATVQRAWDNRGSIGEIDFRSVLKYLADGPSVE